MLMNTIQRRMYEDSVPLSVHRRIVDITEDALSGKIYMSGQTEKAPCLSYVN